MAAARLYLIVDLTALDLTPANSAPADRADTTIPAVADIAAAQAAGADIASALLVLPAGVTPDPPPIHALVAAAQARRIAVLVPDDAARARSLGADGVHLDLTGVADPRPAITAARAALGPSGIVGVAVAASRHAAMSAGEAGVDYVAFGGPDAPDMVAWWAELFETPCVAFGLDGGGLPDDEAVATATADGADFVAVALAVSA